MEEEEATQQATQPLPGHEGEPPSNATDYTGVLCLLHPASTQACAAVEHLSRDGSDTAIPEANGEDEDEPATQLATPGQVQSDVGLDIALRLSPGPKDPTLGFVFGRNPHRCDIVIGETQMSRRISNTHFRIFQNPKGVLMLEDFSMNGTWVDGVKLGGKNPPDGGHGNGNTHALFAGSIIYMAPGEEIMRFLVKIPSQSGSRICSAGGTPGISFGIDPGPAPLPTTPRLPHLRGNKKYPPSPGNNKNLAAIRRGGAPLRDDEKHSSVAITTDPGWDGGGTYKIMEIIGAGAFATVKRAVIKKTGEVFAVKMIQKRAFANQANGGKTSGMRKEVEILQKLNHPNIVSCSACFEDPAHIYIVMEYVGGGDLNQYLKRNEYMPEDMVQEVSRQVLNGIKYVHSMRISHRDLKPDNILIASEEPLMIKISDFGLAKMIQSEETFLKTFCGTMLYLAPEVYPGYATAMVVGGGSFKRKRNPREDAGREDALGAKGRRRYSEAVDMWSLGCVIHMLLTGKPAFEGKNQDDMLKLILRGFRNTAHLDRVLGRGCDVVKDFLGRLLQVDPINRMMEAEALDHEWLKMGSDRSSSSMEEDQEDEICHEGDSGYHMVEKQREEWTKIPSLIPGKWVDSVGVDEDASDGKSPPPKPEDDALSGAVRKMSFQAMHSLRKDQADDSIGGSFLSVDNADAESQVGSRMFHPPPDISIRGCSSESPDDNASMYLTASVGLPNNNVSTSEEAPAVYDRQAEFASQAVPGSEVRAVEDSVAGTAALVDKLRQQQTNGQSQVPPAKSPAAEASNFSSFDDPAVVYSTPYSTQLIMKTTFHYPSHPNLPLSQPWNVQLEPKNFIKPKMSWGKLVPIEGSVPYKTIYLNRQTIRIGRSSSCTYTHPDPRISKTHLGLMLAIPGVSCQPPDDNNWRPQTHMKAWIKVWGTNGCRLNGRKKRTNGIARVYNGDVIHLYWDSSSKDDFLAFRCEFTIGSHTRYEPEISDEDTGVREKAAVNAERGNHMATSMATTMPIESSFEACLQRSSERSSEGSSERSSEDVE
ncbi:uncharacterized protein H6S33_002337 [Morchella sextelata]|uniref:uncharacterized protein n=1 Tax=Morchella sextelata TaxID=1174677 RepID=UPI001D057D44|nr:uncharacterized protein H6S33_002337 [Morchella sextelata]KAH0608285.1 hypothetical protein H6S33_002337 [Morchella sextelata]